MSNYSNWVRTLPCSVTGYLGPEVEPHHIVGHNWLTGKCGSKKGSDLSCIPLRHELHMQLHSIGHRTFENLHNFSQLEAMIKTILQAEKDGILEL